MSDSGKVRGLWVTEVSLSSISFDIILLRVRKKRTVI